MKIKLWHKIRHDDYTVTEIDAASGIFLTVQNIIRYGGHWLDDDTFIPWHSISYIQVVKEQP